jgi:hypothetical protein
MTVFPARRTLKGALFLIVALLLTALFGIVVDAEGESLGGAVLAFGLVLAALVVVQTLRPWWHYGVGAEGIEIRRLTGTRILPRAQIAAVERVDGTRIEQIVAGPQWKGVEAGRAMDLGAGIRARRELGRIIAYVTVPIVLTQSVRGGPLAVRKVGARAPGEFVLVTLVDGTMRALSPREVTAFVREWEESGNP